MNAPPAVRVLVSLLVSAAAATAALLFLATALMTEGFAGRVPRGENAMGLIVLLLAAALGCAWGGGLDWTGRRPAWLATLVALGVGGAGFGMLLAWAEQIGPWVPYVGWLAGGIGPLLACALLLACAWVPAQTLQLARWPRLAGVALLPVAAFGFLLGAYGLRASWLDQRADAERAAAAFATEQAEQARQAALTPAARLQETLAGYDPGTPLWILAAMLRETPEPELRALLIERALEVPDFEAELARNLASEARVYRHAAVELVRDAPAARRTPAWREALAVSLRATAHELAADPDWFVAQDPWHPDPPAHLRALFEAAARLGPEAELDEALRGLRRALDALPPERRAQFDRLDAPA
jgi:hypothetical protein